MTQAYPGYPPQQTVPQQFAPQQFPQQYAQQPQPFAPQFPVQQGYPQPVMAPPPAPLATGSIDDFYNQPSAGGGKSLKLDVVGRRYIGIVVRTPGNGDIQQQTDVHGRPQFFKDGRPKFVMKVPLQMQPSAEYPDGLATWFVKGHARDELARAMSEAGAPAGPPEAGAIIDITYTHDRPSGQGMNPAKQVAIAYARPDGSSPAPTAQPAPQPTAAPSPAPVQQPAPGVPYPATPTTQPGISPVQMPVIYQQPIPSNTASDPAQQPVAQAPAQPPAPQAPQPAAPQPPAGLSQEQQELLARLTGGQPA